MAVFKCKMCGGTIEFEQGATVGVCDSCGTKQTLPTANDEVITNLHNRATTLRLKCEFDKAEEIYNKILVNNPNDAEAHWGIILCKYGIEYVEDPKTYKRIPTCHRTSFEAILADEDYKAAMENGDAAQRELYEAEAKEIDRIQKEILAIVKNEKPFDVFICYKETDENGKRTQDSVIANDIYYQLTQEGFKVFYAAITLEDKLGQEYEPYIFAALNSAKVMLVVGSKPEYFTAVWVKNEWSRFLKLMKTDKKKLLIPCYKDMDAYELPEEFAHLQAQDMGKIGFINDLVRGIKKVVSDSAPKETVKETVVVNGGNTNVAPLLKRAFMFLEDGEWGKADDFCEQVLNQDPENAQAYLGKLMAELQVRKQENLKDCEKPFDPLNNYQKTLRFADPALADTLTGYIAHIKERNENNRLNSIYSGAVSAMQSAKNEAEYKSAAVTFRSITGYKDADEKAKQCLDKAEICRKDAIYASAKSSMSGVKIAAYEAAIKTFQTISGWKDADEQIGVCRKKIEEIKAKEEADRLEAERKAEEHRIAEEKAEKKRKMAFAIGTSIVVACIAFLIVLTQVIIPNRKYNAAVALMDDGQLAKAAISFSALGEFRDAKEQSAKLWDGIVKRDAVTAGGYHTVGLKSDGTVVAVGYNADYQCCVYGWTDIVAVSAGEHHTVGLKSDGTVVAVGNNGFGQCDVSGWTDIVAVSAGGYHTVGLRLDGTIVAVGDNEDGQCDVSDWTDIVAVSAGGYQTVGLRLDGTVVAVGTNKFGQCDVSDWTDIVAVSAGALYTVGLKSDGTVVAVGYNADGQCDVSGWTDIVAVSAGKNHTVGLRLDGTVVAVGDNAVGSNTDSRCDVSGWTDIKLPNQEN